VTRLFDPRLACGTALLCTLACLPAWALALELNMPGSAELVQSAPGPTSRHPIAFGPWADGTVPTRDAEGHVQEFIWQITGDGIDTLSLLATLRAQLEGQEYEIGFTCAASACGGFDFRHALPLGDAPDMHIDLGDFHYLTASRAEGDQTQFAALTISQGGATGFVHLALVQPQDLPEAPVVQSTRTPDVDDPLPPLGVIDTLLSEGAAPLDDLTFQTGASGLSGERYDSLVALAAFLEEDADRRVVLVGHTDAMGSLAGNIALSEARANAVRTFLINELGVSPAQVEAQGIGFLSPRATNDTEAGREANRRVEVVLATAG